MKTLKWIVIVLMGWAVCGNALAASATWTGASSNVYTTSTNWSPAAVPNTGAATAVFGASAVTGISVSTVTVGTFSFTAPAPAYTFSVGSLDFKASGIVNSSANTQTFNVSTKLQFDNSSSAGTNVAVATTGTGQVGFNNTSTAGSANITANAGTTVSFNTSGAGGAGTSTLTATGTNAAVIFNGTSDANTANITASAGGAAIFNNTSTANGATILATGSGSKVLFNNTATAGSANITANAGTTVTFTTSGAGGAGTSTLTATGAGSGLIFNGASDANTANITASAGGAAIFNNTATADAATVVLTGSGSKLTFNNTSTAGSANITANAGTTVTFNTSSTGGAGTSTLTTTGAASSIIFNGTSDANTANITASAGGAAIFNNTGTANGATILATGSGSKVVFNNTATAGSATITNSAGGVTNFNNTSTAGSSDITINSSSATVFAGTATAATATLHNNAGGNIAFNNSATAASSTITNTGGGITNFNNTSTAGSANITINSSSATLFSSSATAATATFTNNAGGVLTFNNTSTAASAAITNAGTLTFNDTTTTSNAVVGNTGTVAYNQTADGGTAVINSTGGVLDISGSAGIGLGSLNGTGTTTLGAQKLSLGVGDLGSNYSGTISDSGGGSFAKVGAGLVTLSGNNTYTGGTTVAAGTLQVGNTNALGANSGALAITGGTLDLNGFNVTVGAFSGTSGIVTSNGGASGLTAGDGSTQTYAGVIQDGTGSVSFTKQGSGTLTFTGANTYSGGTTVTAGTLRVGSASALGTGNVLVNGGTLSTDGVQTAINVAGNYSETSGTLSLALLGPTTNNNEQLAVTGTAALGGSLLINGNNVAVTANLTYDLVHSTGGVSGVFGSTTLENLPLPAGFFTVLAYTADDVTLTFRHSITSIPGLTPNQRAVGGYIDFFAPTVQTGNFGKLVNNIYPLTGNLGALGGALEQISPQSLQILSHVGFDHVTFTGLQLANHLANLRDGLTGFDGSQITYSDSSLAPTLSQINNRLLAWNPAAATPGLISDVVDPIFLGCDEKGRKITLATEPADRWSTFIAGNVVLADLSHNQDLAHQSYTMGSVTAGADYRIDNYFTVGGLFAYGHTDATLDHIGSKATVDTYSPGIYASYVDGGWYGNGLFSYDYNTYAEDRNVQIGALSGVNHGTPNGNQYAGNLTGGYEFKQGAWKFGPVATVQYVNLGIDSFSESGPTALNVQSQSAESFRSQLGFATRYKTLVDSCYGSFSVTPHLTATWQHEYLDDSRGISSQFNQIGAGSFTVLTSKPDRDSALIDLGLDAQFSKEVTFFVDYSTQVGQDHYCAQSIQGGLKIGF